MSTEAGDLSLLNKYQRVNAEHRTDFIVMHLQDLSMFQIRKVTKYQHVTLPWVLQKFSEMITFRNIILSHEKKADVGSFSFFMAVLGLHCFVQAFSRCSSQGVALYLWCAGFSLRCLLLLQGVSSRAWASVVVVHRFVVPGCMGSSQTRD